MINSALLTYVKALREQHDGGKSEFLTCSFIRDTGWAVAAGVSVSYEACSPLAVEELMRQGGDCIFHLGLTAKAGMSSA